MATKAKEKVTDGTMQISVPKIKIEQFQLTIVGDSPLICHKWSEKAKKAMLDVHMKKAKTAKEAKNPVEDFINSLYWLTDSPTKYTIEAFEKSLKNGAKFGFPATAFKSAAVSAGYRAKITKDKVSSYGAFHIMGEYVEIEGVPEMREDMVKLNGGAPDIRYRGEFKNWKATFVISFNTSLFSIEQIVNLFNLGGFACGVGEWRIEKGGVYGMFHAE